MPSFSAGIATAGFPPDPTAYRLRALGEGAPIPAWPVLARAEELEKEGYRVRWAGYRGNPTTWEEISTEELEAHREEDEAKRRAKVERRKQSWLYRKWQELAREAVA